MNAFPSPEALRSLLESHDTESIRAAMAETHPHEAAQVLLELTDDEAWAILRRADEQDAAAAFSHLPIERQARLVEGRSPQEIAGLATNLQPDDRADLLKTIEEPVQDRVLAALPPEQRAETERLAGYSEETVGSVMSTEFAAVPADMTASDALDLLRLDSPRKESIHHIFVIDEQSRLVGVIAFEDLVFGTQTAEIRTLMDPDVISTQADAPRDEAARLVKDYDIVTLAVTDSVGRLIGVVTVDDVLDFEETEATTDFHKMAPIGLMKGGIKHASLLVLYRARVPWLLVLVFMNIFSGAGIAYFEDTIEAVVALVFFLPLLIDSGGNAGSQSATLMVRALATGDVRMRDWLRLLGREFGISLALGLSMAAAVMLIAGFRAPQVIVPVGMTMVLTVVFGSVIGMSLPFLLTKLKCDPATASAPLITSIADIGGVLIYFSIATWWLGDAIRAAAEAAG